MADQNPNTPQAPAVENFVEQKPEQNPVDKIASDIGLPEQPNAIPAPATPENQAETQETTDREAQNKKIFSPDRIANLKKQGMSDSDAHQWIIREQRRKSKMKDEKEEQQIQETRQQSTLRRAELSDELIALEEDLAFAEQQGYDSTKLLEKQSALTQEKDGLDRALESVTPATDEDVDKAMAPTQADVNQAGEQVRKDAALASAQEEEQKQKVQELAKTEVAQEEKIKEEDLKIQAIEPANFWKNKTTGDKILGAFAIMLGGISVGLGAKSNPAMDILNKAIDDDIKAQNLNNDQVLAKKKHALKLAELQLRKFEANTDNQLKKVKINSMINDMQQSQLAIHQKQKTALKMSAKEGFTNEEKAMLSPEELKRVVPIGNRNFLANAPELAKNLNREIIPTAKASLRGLNRLDEIMNNPANQLDPTVRGEVSTIFQSLKGSLRIELFGPGVMTDTENKMADRIIGNPNKLFTLSGIEKAKLKVLRDKITLGTRDKMHQAGIPLNKSANEKAILQMQKKNPKMNRGMIIGALKNTKKWNDSEEMGF